MQEKYFRMLHNLFMGMMLLPKTVHPITFFSLTVTVKWTEVSLVGSARYFFKQELSYNRGANQD